MPLAKSADLLRSLDLAFSVDKDPLKTARLYSTDGIKAGLTACDHPWLGLILLSEAYPNSGLYRYILQAGEAMRLVVNTLERKPPGQYRKNLADPARQVEGYPIDQFANIRLEDGGDHIRAVLKAEANPPPPPPKRKPLDTLDAYILTDGKLVHVGYQGHIGYCSDQGHKRDEAEQLGWIKLSSGRVHIPQRPKERQLRKLEAWCKANKRDYGVVEDGLFERVGQEWYARSYFTS